MSPRVPAPATPARVVKLGGRLLDDPAALAGLAAAIAGLPGRVVVVHGGGDAIGELQGRLGLAVEKRDGLRVTTAGALDVVTMVLAGRINTRVVAALHAAKVDALGLSGVDRGLLDCRRVIHPAGDLGFVGEVAAVRVSVLAACMAEHVVPVVAPLGVDAGGQVYNVNADDAAAAIARALGVELDLVSDVGGVVVDGAVVTRLAAPEAERLIAAGVIHGGMVPKVRAALGAIASGVPRARIVDPEGLTANAGTVFSGDRASPDPDAMETST